MKQVSILKIFYDGSLKLYFTNVSIDKKPGILIDFKYTNQKQMMYCEILFYI